jgi:hypothetical protein
VSLKQFVAAPNPRKSYLSPITRALRDNFRRTGNLRSRKALPKGRN